MSQQELFQKALAAKLAGDDVGFQQAVREAIVAKTKSILGEKPLAESQYKGPGVEQVDRDWFFVDQPFNVPEGNAAGIPAGSYTCSVNATGVSYGGSLEIEALEVHPADDDATIANLTGDAAYQFFGLIPQAAQNWISSTVEYAQDDRGEAAEFDRQQDIAADRSWDRQNNMDGLDHPF